MKKEPGDYFSQTLPRAVGISKCRKRRHLIFLEGTECSEAPLYYLSFFYPVVEIRLFPTLLRFFFFYFFLTRFSR